MLRLFLLSLAFMLSLLIFQSGFLLKRNELHFNSTCSDAKVEPSSCWMPPQHGKIVLLLVDALRYDFLVPLAPQEKPSHFRGHMPSVANLVNQGAAIGTILADPPTTTLQRIKALTTGTLPTFIDASDNFSPDVKVLEDNFLTQARSLNRSLVFFGDDTWLSLYPEVFSSNLSRGYPSFDVNDLDTVDEAVRKHTHDMLQQNIEVDLVIAHVLGIDHCGHKFGPTHAQMANVLKRTDSLISRIATTLQKDDLFVVIGDHGMTASGDHGGDSDDETHAGIFIYSSGRSLMLPSTPIRQIDLVPTLSLLLGVPIPFSNLGIVITKMFSEAQAKVAVDLNYVQMMRFANTYASTFSFPELYEMTSREAGTTEEQIRNMVHIQHLLRTAWTQFDWPLMRTGLVSLLEVILFLFSGRVIDIPVVILRSGCLLLQLAVLSGGAEDNPAMSMLMIVLPLSIVYSLGSIFLSMLSFRIGSPIRAAAFIAVVLHSLSFLSNSFVVYEGHSVRFLLQTVVLIAAFVHLKNHMVGGKNRLQPISFTTTNEGISALAALAILRLESLFHRCREEEIGCELHYPAQILGALSSDAQFWRMCISFASLGLFCYLVGRRLRSSPLSLVWALSRLSLLAVGAHQLVQVAISSHGSSSHLHHSSMVIAQFVYACSLTAVIITVVNRKKSSLTDVQLSISYAISWSVLLLIGDGLVPSFLLFVTLTVCIFQLSDKESLPWMCSLLIPFGFYFTAHSPTLSAIPWQAAFVGVPGNFFIRFVPAVLVFSHLFCSTAVVSFLLQMHPLSSHNSFLSLVASSSLRALAVSVAALLHRRHLMVWKIFAPRFIFEAVSFLVLLLLVCVSRLHSLRRVALSSE